MSQQTNDNGLHERSIGQVRSQHIESYRENVSQKSAAFGEMHLSHHMSGNAGFITSDFDSNCQNIQFDQASLPYMLCDAQGMNEVYEGFAARLPGPEILKTLRGRMEGAVKFVRHNNGDISAHQWSNATMSWCHIGQYSCARKRTEGPMSSLQLSGRANEMMAGQESTLAYFVALAHQCQTSICEAYVPSSCVESMPNAAPVREVNYDNMLEPEMKHVRSYRENISFEQPALSKSGSAIAKENGESTFYAMPVHLHENKVRSSNRSYDALNFHDLEDPFVAMSQQQVTYEVQTSPVAFHKFDGKRSMTRKGKTDSKLGSRHDLIEMKEASASPSAHTDSILVKPTVFAQPNKILFKPPQPKENVPPARNMAEKYETPGSGAIRTVLYDPLARAETPEYHQETPEPGQMSKRTDRPASEFSVADTIQTETYAGLRASLYSSDESLPGHGLSDLRQSTPEPGWRDRQVEILTFLTPNMTNEQLMETHLNTPQKWKGPFFDGSNSPCESISLANTRYKSNLIRDDANGFKSKYSPSYFRELEDWWSSGKQSRLQSELSRHLQSGSSSATAETDHRLSHALVGVFESLSSYVQRPAHQQKTYFDCFGPPPEWCIDRSEKGALTFFGENWGKAPQRLGRDPRYRPLPPQPPIQAPSKQVAAGYRRYDAMEGSDRQRRHDLQERDIAGW